MKKIFLFLAVASTTMFVSCSDDDSNGDGGTPAATSIVLAANVTSVELGESVTFTVTDNNAKVVTASATILANDVEISGATWTPDAAATYTVKATYKNSANITLTSNVVTVTVSEPVVVPTPNNSIVVGTEAYPTSSTESMLYYLGTTSANINVFVANAYEQVGTGEAAEYPNDVYVYFTSMQVDTQYIDLPSLGDYTFGTNANAMRVIDANVILNDVEVLETGVSTQASMNLSDIVGTADTTTWAFTYSILLADNTTATGEYHGNWTFSNQSQASGKSSAKTIQKVSNAQIKANLQKVMAMKK